MTQTVPDPGLLALGVDGVMKGATSSYEKRLGDMGGVYRDDAAYRSAVADKGADFLVYRVEEHRNVDGEGALIIGTSTLQPGRYGDEFAVTRGHLHAKADRAELYYCLSGTGVMLLETLDGRSEALPMGPGRGRARSRPLGAPERQRGRRAVRDPLLLRGRRRSGLRTHRARGRHGVAGRGATRPAAGPPVPIPTTSGTQQLTVAVAGSSRDSGARTMSDPMGDRPCSRTSTRC